MTLFSLEIPEAVDDLASWLESQLVGPDLGMLVAELAAVRSSDSSDRSIDELMGREMPMVLSRGLTGIPAEVLRPLLRSPELLLQLQERVLLEGGEFWDGLIASSNEVASLVARGRDRLHSLYTDPPTTVRSAPWFLRPFVVSCTTAALVLVAVFAIQSFAPTKKPAPATIGWGWAKPGALPDEVSSTEYLQTLVAAAKQWSKKRPTTTSDVAVRLAQFRQGCTVLILAEHKPLNDTDHKWLVDRCRVWADQLDQHLVTLESGKDPIIVRGEIDATIDGIVGELQERAALTARSATG